MKAQIKKIYIFILLHLISEHSGTLQSEHSGLRPDTSSLVCFISECLTDINRLMLNFCKDTCREMFRFDSITELKIQVEKENEFLVINWLKLRFY